MTFHMRRHVFATWNRQPRPSALLLREVQRMEMLAVDVDLLAEQIDSAIRFHVMGYRAERAYADAHKLTRQYLKRGAV
jgi:hypothetical protein